MISSCSTAESPPVKVKICGITTEQSYHCCLAYGVDYVGIMHYDKSPRHIPLDQAKIVLDSAPRSSSIVAVTVNASDHTIDAIIRTIQPDMLQCHGHESATRIDAIKHRFGLPVIKALSVATAQDLDMAQEYQHADYWLWDAKPADRNMPSGGNALCFDWNLLRQHHWSANDRPWFLAGGLNAENVENAIKISGAKMIDLSSGVEQSRGVKSIAKIATLMQRLGRKSLAI